MTNLRPLSVLLALGALLGAPAAAATANSNRLEVALEAVRAEDLEADLHFLASDELGGRDTPSPGLRVAARFLRSRLQRLGWQPGAPDGYFWTYPLFHQLLDEEATYVELRASGPDAEPARLVFAEDYFLLSGQEVREAEVAAGVVFCGRGSEAEFQAADVAGRWALCLEGDASWRHMRRSAREADAVGLIVGFAPDAEGPPAAQRYAGQMSLVRAGGVRYPRDGEPWQPPSFPRIALSRGGLQRLLAASPLRPADAGPGWVPEAGADLGVELVDHRELVGDGGTIDLENVCGLWPGSDPELSREVLLLSAHYDHVGTRDGKIYNGADDNGSGTAVLLAVAEALSELGPLRRTVLLMWVSGEEKGLYGSKAWAADPWLPEGHRVVCNVNVDMVGRNDPAELWVTPTAELEQYNGLTRLVERLGPLEGFERFPSADKFYERSDQYEFAKLGIPVCFLFAGVHEDYHKPSDTPDKLDYDKVRRVARLVLRVVHELQDDTLDL